jgi:hypothetical protein
MGNKALVISGLTWNPVFSELDSSFLAYRREAGE